MKLLALTPWDISRPETGGTQRCHTLLTSVTDLTTFALVWDETQTAHTKLNGMNYRAIYAGDEARNRATKLLRNGIKTYDPIPRLVNDDLHDMRQAIDEYDPDLIILEHPWLIDLTDGRPFLYDAHNFEAANTAMQFGRNSLDFDLVCELERDATTQAEHITYCSTANWQGIQRNYHGHAEGTHIPNGAHIPRKQTTGKNRNIIFIGSTYGPNVYAAQALADLAHQLPEYHIHLVGGSSQGVETSATNVTRHGHVTNEQLDRLLLGAHLFVNIAQHGSGTSLKIAQALAYGIPVLATTIGARGYEPYCNIVDDIREYPETIGYITNNWTAQHNHARSGAHKYDWANITHNFNQVLNALQ